MDELMKYLLGIGITIIGYFLRSTMQELKDVRKQSDHNTAQLDLVRLDYINKFDNLTDRVAELKETLNELIKELKTLNKYGQNQ